MKSPLRLCASIALFCLHVQAQVTGEGGSISGVAGTSAQVTQTASQGTGSPTNYYSSVHPQITLPRCVPALRGLRGLGLLIWLDLVLPNQARVYPSAEAHLRTLH